MITARKYISKKRRRVYGYTGVMEVETVTECIYSADCRVDRHLISISSYHTMKIHTLFFTTFGLTQSVRNVVDCQFRVVACLYIWFLCFLNQKRSFPWIEFGCRKGWCGVLMVGSLTSSSIVSPLWPPSSSSLNILLMGMSWCSSNYALVPSAARLTVCI